MTSVLVTHADEPIGRRIVKTLWHSPEIEHVVATGPGSAPRAFDRFLSSPGSRISWQRADLSRHRSVSDLFGSSAVRSAAIDTVVHVPAHSVDPGRRRTALAGLARRTAEARLVLQHALDSRTVSRLVALGSAFVYRLSPGNANRLSETSPLELDPDVAPEIRSWIDCDMTFHAEIGNAALAVALLRLPAVVASGGFVYLHPLLEGPPGPRLRPLGFDPLCAVVADKDVASAVRAAVLSSACGVFNVAGREALPLSWLARWTRRQLLPAPGPLLDLVSGASAWTRIGLPGLAAAGGPHQRFGFTLDVRRAERELGFRPGYRIGLARRGDGGVQVETSAL